MVFTDFLNVQLTNYSKRVFMGCCFCGCTSFTVLSSSPRRTAVEESSLPLSQKGKSLIHQHCNRSIILSIQWPLGSQLKKIKNLKSREKPNTLAVTLHTLWMSHHCVNQVSKTEQSHNVNACSVLKSMAKFLLIFGIFYFLRLLRLFSYLLNIQ